MARNLSVENGAHLGTFVAGNFNGSEGSVHEGLAFDSCVIAEGFTIDILHCLPTTEFSGDKRQIEEMRVWDSPEDFLAYAEKLAAPEPAKKKSSTASFHGSITILGNVSDSDIRLGNG